MTFIIQLVYDIPNCPYLLVSGLESRAFNHFFGIGKYIGDAKRTNRKDLEKENRKNVSGVVFG